MVDWKKKFKAEYDYARGWLNNTDAFDKNWQPLVKKLRKLMAEDGFDAGEAQSLSDLRRNVVKAGNKKVTEDHGILNAVGAWTEDAGGSVESNAKMRAAALKLLRHVYLLNKSGNKKVWVLSLPEEYREWPSDDLHARAGTQIAARILLRTNSEHFSSQQKNIWLIRRGKL